MNQLHSSGIYTDIESMSDTSSNEHMKLYYRNESQNVGTDSPKSEVCCGICNNKSNKGNFIILSCDHVFHVQCLAEKHFTDIYKFAVIDSEYFVTRKCHCCGGKLQTEELMFLHSKFLSCTKDHLESHQIAMSGLEERMNKMKEELKVCYDYKHKLECDREKAKQIVSTLLNMLP